MAFVPSEKKDPRDWTSQQVGKWLESLGDGYQQYSKDFADHDIDGTTLFSDDSEALLGDVGITSKNEKKKFLTELQKLKKQIEETEKQALEVEIQIDKDDEGDIADPREKQLKIFEKQLKEREQQIHQMKEALDKTEEAFKNEEKRTEKLSELLSIVRRESQRKREELEREILESTEQHKVILQLYEAEQEALTEEISIINEDIDDKKLLLKEALDQIEKAEYERDALEEELLDTLEKAQFREDQLKAQIKEETDVDKEKRLMEDLKKYQHENAKKEGQFQDALKQIQVISNKQSERDKLQLELQTTRTRVIERETRLQALERQLKEQQEITERATEVLLNRKKNADVDQEKEIEELANWLQRRRSQSQVERENIDEVEGTQVYKVEEDVESHHFQEKLQEKDLQIDELRKQIVEFEKMSNIENTDVCNKNMCKIM